ncbi:alpha/beta hydrolase [Emticicia sp. BO119]|uniref:alpha/beta hydrolase n=1 Tax=Emticicia sp. BO119 TaxID=2757768 RepID=UPI0015F0D124|nr:alpha/beta fold hydrolase [Emticicia sp. BO119]MBA4851333.1 alpha/beta fold hydrolase [Emticicia sp. BO119]
MKKILKRTMYILLLLIGVTLVIGLILAFWPNESRTGHVGVTPEEAAKLRQNYVGPHDTLTTTDGEVLFLRRWNPDSIVDSKKDLAVLIFHGITAHSGAYDMAGKTLAAGGYTTFGLDYRGHGLSDGNRADSPGKERFTADLAESIKYIKGLGFPKVVVMGHSLGVVSAITVANAVPKELTGLILLSAAYERKKEAEVVSPTAFQKAKIVANSILRPSHQAVEYYREGMVVSKDPLYNYTYTLRFVTMIPTKDLRIQQDMRIPIMVGIGDKDELFTVEKARELYDLIPGNQKEFVVLKDMYHAKIPVESWETCVEWLNKTFIK